MKKISNHDVELDLYQGQGNSCAAQNWQSGQNNPVVVVDCERSQSKYSYEIMNKFSLYCISMLTDDTNISNLRYSICSAIEDLASTW